MTAPTTEQVWEARERLLDAPDEIGGRSTGLALVSKADIRTVLDALDALDAKDESAVREDAAIREDAGPDGIGCSSSAQPLCPRCEWTRASVCPDCAAAPSAPAEPFEKCPVSGDFVFTAAPQTEAEPRRTDISNTAASGTDGNSPTASPPVPSVTPMVTDADIDRAWEMFGQYTYIPRELARRVLEDYASQKGAEK